jgi:hypothetical protein
MVDVVLEVRDARIPVATHHPQVCTVTHSHVAHTYACVCTHTHTHTHTHIHTHSQPSSQVCYVCRWPSGWAQSHLCWC